MCIINGYGEWAEPHTDKCTTSFWPLLDNLTVKTCHVLVHWSLYPFADLAG